MTGRPRDPMGRFAYEGTPWNEEQDAWLIENYANMGIPTLAKETQRNSKEIRKRAKELDIKCILPNSEGFLSAHTNRDVELPTDHAWTPIEDEYLKQNYSKQPMSVIRKHIRRSKPAILGRAHVLKLTSILKRNRYWTGEDDAFLKENYGIKANEDISETLGRTHDAIRRRAVDLCLANIRGRVWGEDEDEIIRKTMAEHPYTTSEDLQKLLPHRSIHAIGGRRSKLKLFVRLKTYKPEKSKYVPHSKGSNESPRNYRRIMAHCIGRQLLPTEGVHHINFLKDDNQVDNLIIVNKSEHMKTHLTLYPLVHELMSKHIVGYDRENQKYILLI